MELSGLILGATYCFLALRAGRLVWQTAFLPETGRVC